MEEVQVPVPNRKKYKEYVESNPEVESFLLFVAKIQDPKERLRVILERRLKLPQYESETLGLEAEWYINEILPKRTPSFFVILCQQSLKETPLAIFSYIDEQDGLLRRCHFTIVCDKKSKSLEQVEYCSKKIISYGGNSSVSFRPEVRWNSINLLAEPSLSPIWLTWYLVKFYSMDLLSDAIQTKKFDRNDIEKYELKLQQPIPPLNMHYLSKLL